MRPETSNIGYLDQASNARDAEEVTASVAAAKWLSCRLRAGAPKPLDIDIAADIDANTWLS